jgi:membrane protease YdiL (CAAX protease family)
VGALGAGLLYALAHLSLGSPLLVGLALACGLFWSGLRSWSGSLVPPLLAHLVWDAVIILAPVGGRGS